MEAMDTYLVCGAILATCLAMIAAFRMGRSCAEPKVANAVGIFARIIRRIVVGDIISRTKAQAMQDGFWIYLQERMRDVDAKSSAMDKWRILLHYDGYTQLSAMLRAEESCIVYTFTNIGKRKELKIPLDGHEMRVVKGIEEYLEAERAIKRQEHLKEAERRAWMRSYEPEEKF